MVQLITAISGFVDTSVIKLKAKSGMNGNSNRLLIQSSLHLGRVTGRHISVALDLKSRIIFLALTISSSVRISRFQGNTIVHNVFESLVHQTTVATLVSVFGAIDESLFGKLGQFSGGHGMKSFNSTNGGESPAGTALALVFGRGHGILFAPVKGFFEIVSWKDSHFVGSLGSQSCETGEEFLFGKVHKGVLSQGVGKILGILSLDK